MNEMPGYDIMDYYKDYDRKEDILYQSFYNSYKSSHALAQSGYAEGQWEHHPQGAHHHSDYIPYPSYQEYIGGHDNMEGNDSGVNSEDTEEYTEDIPSNDTTKKVETGVPLSAWKAKQLKLSHAGVIKRRRDANRRERKRMNGLNEAFERLREHIPGGRKNSDKKLSKMETLQMANIYIRSLVQTLQQT